MTDPLIGVDLGTTHTLVSALTPEGPQVLAGPMGELLIPSAVALDDGGQLLVGAAALARLDRDPGAGVRAFKREMGTDRTWTLGAHELDASALSAMILREAKAVAEERLGQEVRRVVITVPAYFQEPQRKATAQAGALAGLEVVRLINEPTAAAMAHGLHDAETERRCCVVDLGGGTLDITVLDIFDGVIEVIGSSGDARLGGEDFTDALLAHAMERAGLSQGARGLTVATLRAACEQAKRDLGVAPRVTLLLPAPDPERWRPSGPLHLSREDFARLTRPLLARVERCVVEALRSAGVAAESVNELLLVGGGTRTQGVAELVTGLMPQARLSDADPDLAIAQGAAVQCGLIEGHAAVEDIVVTDVLSHTLGIGVVRQGKGRWHDGYFLPVLHRNTTLPARRVERVSTVHHAQTRLRIQVFQGEHRRVEHNTLIGEMELIDLEVLKDEGGRHDVDVAFTHDLSGLLEVEATKVSDGSAVSLLIEQRAGELNAAQRARALEAIAALKVHPRELLPNRLLLEQAQTAYVRAQGLQRQLLDRALFAFEDALERQDGDDIAQIAPQLRALLLDLAKGGPS